MFQCVCCIVLNQLNCFISVFILLVVLMSFIHSGLSQNETHDSEHADSERGDSGLAEGEQHVSGLAEGETGDSETSEATVQYCSTFDFTSLKM